MRTCGSRLGFGVTLSLALLLLALPHAAQAAASASLDSPAAAKSADVPWLSVSPSARTVKSDAGATSFAVSNAGGGVLNWTATCISGTGWMRITAGSSGTQSGNVVVAYDENGTRQERAGTILVEGDEGCNC